MTLEPGDIVATGTPSGLAGDGPANRLEDGDELVVSSPQLGELHTTIARQQAQGCLAPAISFRTGADRRRAVR